MTEIILQQDIENLGEAGEVVDVKAGYARNYLLPRGLAIPATEGNVKRIEQERRRIDRARTRERDQAEELSQQLADRSLSFSVRAGEEGRLFGSVTTTDIADRLAEEGIEVDRRLIRLEEPIKELGVYRVAVELHADVQPELKVWVVAEE
ncbi:MAG: 50S ribosomal protein L9 [Candidatus Palauibacterales bacterium]|nr:50S ribosomal protein L9 [Candidatus Palauibacterales bacterium]MDP2530137.1 50S ribosomal protein L9 [Candidatus Palauibacterales bacterium]MDP2582552.1 50S ribosomal protein L9 [Candidatus Palauibacterales bacterium]